MAVVLPIRNGTNVAVPLQVAYPMTARHMHVLKRGGRYYYSNYKQTRIPALMLPSRHHPTHSLTTKTTTRRPQQQRSLRSQASLPKTTTTPQHQQPPLPSPSSSSPSNNPAGDSLLTLYFILFQRAALAAGIIYCFSEYVADITLCEGM
jgi:hypothetical protein